MKSCLTVVLLALALTGCSSAASGEPADAGADILVADHAVSVDSGPAVDTDASAPADAGDCNTVQNGASSVTVQQVASASPAAAGGAIGDGTYYVTAVVVFTGDGGAAGPRGDTVKETVVVHGSAFQAVAESLGTVTRFNGTFAIDGGSITNTHTCPTTSVDTLTSFTASATSIEEWGPTQGGTLSYTFTKQ